MHTDVQREGGSGRSVAGCCIVSAGSEKKNKKKGGGGVLFASRNAHLERLRGQRQQQGYLSE